MFDLAELLIRDRFVGREILNFLKISHPSNKCCFLTKYQMFLLFFFLLHSTIYSQTDWVRWEKSDPTYQIKNSSVDNEFDFKIDSPSDIIIKPVINAYWFFVSDVDGANCPFHPSCSRFFLQSVNHTNFAQGILMFFDRFTRDTNFINRKQHYPYYDAHHFYDPITSYTLNSSEIKYISPKTSIKE